MKKTPPLVPAESKLLHGLTSVFGNGTGRSRFVRLEDRQRNAGWKSASSEILTIRLSDECRIQVFAKYETESMYSAFGHRGGVALEAFAYKELLADLPLLRPDFHGSCQDPETGNTWLFLEYIENALPVHQATEPDAIVAATGWIGRFHAFGASMSPDVSSIVPVYDEEYYLGWARRTCEFAGPLLRDYPWLDNLTDRTACWSAPLMAAPQVLIHGEYYPKNVLARDGAVYPIDWETIAIGPGEIDLASLTDNWRDEIVQDCVEHYCRARWPEGSPTDFDRRMTAARLYLHLRWLGDRPYRTESERLRWRFEALRVEAERLGCI